MKWSNNMITFADYSAKLKANALNFEQATAAQERLIMIMVQILDAPEYEHCPPPPVLKDPNDAAFLLRSELWLQSLPKKVFQELVVDDFSESQSGRLPN